MTKLNKLENKITKRMQEILNKKPEEQTAQEVDEFVGLQRTLREIHKIKIMIDRMENE